VNLWEERRELLNKQTIAYLFHGNSPQYQEARNRVHDFYSGLGDVTIKHAEPHQEAPESVWHGYTDEYMDYLRRGQSAPRITNEP
jgi:hypothetical protein